MTNIMFTCYTYNKLFNNLLTGIVKIKLEKIDIVCSDCHELIINEALIDERLITFIKKDIKCPGTMHESQKSLKRRIVSVESGLDWTDAVYELLEVPSNLDLTEENVAYNQWYREKYLSVLFGNQKIKYKTFAEWLKERGAKDVDDIEYFNVHD